MPALSFTLFKEKILDGRKKQTIRAVGKRIIKNGDTLYLYWHQRQKDCELLKVTRCIQTSYASYRTIAYGPGCEKLARADGFENAQELRKWFEKVHKPFMGDIFVIIYWE